MAKKKSQAVVLPPVEFLAVLPFCHNVSGFIKPSHSLDDSIFIRNLTAEEYGTIAQAKVDAGANVDANATALFVRYPTDSIDERTRVGLAILGVLYALNHARAAAPASFEYAFYLSVNGGRIAQLVDYTAVDTNEFVRARSHAEYGIAADFDVAALAPFVQLISSGLKRMPRLQITLQRYYNSLMRRSLTDRVVELTIALESLISSEKTELRFRFSLLLSVAAHDDPKRRTAAYELLQKLYDARSGVVHGSGKAATLSKLLTGLEKSWADLDALARQVINYFIVFSEKNDPTLFNKHLVEVILGTQARVEG